MPSFTDGFRVWGSAPSWSVRRNASAVAGWVRNRHDGTVEVAIGGPPEAVDRMLAACRRGPPGALVVDVEQAPYEGPPLEAFTVLPTA